MGATRGNNNTTTELGQETGPHGPVSWGRFEPRAAIDTFRGRSGGNMTAMLLLLLLIILIVFAVGGGLGYGGGAYRSSGLGLGGILLILLLVLLVTGNLKV